jgi:hypothetical protein
VNNELENIWKEAINAHLEAVYCTGISLDELKKIKSRLTQDNLSPGQDLNPAPPA